MIIYKSDYDELCRIARELNNDDEEEVDTLELWERLNEVINNIKA